MRLTKITNTHTASKPVTPVSGKFRLARTFTYEKLPSDRPKTLSVKELESKITFRLPYVTGKIREVITKGKNYPTAKKRYSHRNNALIVEQTIQDNNLEWMFENVNAPKIEVHGEGFAIDYHDAPNGRIVITVNFHRLTKTVIISRDGEMIDFKPQRLGVLNDEV